MTMSRHLILALAAAPLLGIVLAPAFTAPAQGIERVG
jgi:hypothetical protein